MKERPILFSAPMVRAILAGTKTQTRRIVRCVDSDDAYNGATWKEHDGRCHPCRDDLCRGILDPIGPGVACPYGAPGDRLWVRETWSLSATSDYPCPPCWYRADFSEYEDPTHPTNAIHEKGHNVRQPRGHGAARDRCWACVAEREGKFRWRPAIYMPRGLSRLTLEVSGVRVERLQSISTMEAMAEGVAPRPVATGVMSYTHGFRVLWDQINGARASWDANPWVWVVSFARASREGGR